MKLGTKLPQRQSILKAIEKLQAAISYDDPNLHFLENYT